MRRAKGPKCHLLSSEDRMAVVMGFIPPFHHPREELQSSEGVRGSGSGWQFCCKWCLCGKKSNV